MTRRWLDAYRGARPAGQLGLLLAAGLALRMLVAVVLMPESGFRSDMILWADWAHRLADSGPGAFYQPNAQYFNDYPPAYLYVLWALAEAARVWSALTGAPDLTASFLKVPFIIADVGTAAAVYAVGRQIGRPRAGLVAAAFFLFNPAALFDSTIWGQNDSVGTLVVVSSIYMLLRGRTEWASALAVLAALVKFQFAFVIPIVAVVAIRRHLVGRSSDPGGKAHRDVFRLEMSFVAAVVTFMAVCWPFRLVLYSFADKSHSVWDRFIAASQDFPGITLNAFNLWMNPLADVIHVGSSGLTHGSIVDDTVALFTLGGLVVTWQLISNVLFMAVVALALTVVARRDDGQTIVFAALLIAVAFFALPTRVHERYLFPALALGAPLIVFGARYRRLYVALSAVFLADLYWVYTAQLVEDGFDRTALLGATLFSAPGIYAVSAVTVVAMAWLAAVGIRLIRGGSLARDEALASGEPAAKESAAVVASGQPEPTTGAETASPARLIANPPETSFADRAPAGPHAASVVPVAPVRSDTRQASAESAPPAWPRLRGAGIVAALAIASLAAALIAARVTGPDGPWLWNLDMPKIDYPLASFFHDALAHGRLPLWNDQLGLGFPLYAEGQIGAFYPPNWLIYLLPPLQALDITHVLHLALAGTGAGLIALRLGGGRAGALLAAVGVVLSGGIVSKLEWTNFVVAYGWLPWVLLPLVRRPGPTRIGLVAAGVAWGIQALAGHPNLWLFTGLAAATLIVATCPRLVSLRRVAGFALLGGAVGAVQIVPTLLLTTLSVRSTGLSSNDLFASSATLFDGLGFAFANVFVRSGSQSWDLSTTWYPNGSFALLEATAYVGLPILILAAVGVAVRRARPLLAVAGVMAAIPIAAAFHPWFWGGVPILDALRSPVRAYVVVDFVVVLLASIGVARLGRQLGARRRIVALLALTLGGYALVALLAVAFPGSLAALLGRFSIFTSPEQSTSLAAAALTSPFPLVPEVALGLATAALAFRARPPRPRATRWAAVAAVCLAILPLAAFTPQVNTPGTRDAFVSDASPFVQALQAADAHRLLTVGEPGWYSGMPDQLATAGVPDVRAFSSLDLLTSDQLVDELRGGTDTTALRRAVGIDVIVTFGTTCPGTLVAHIADPVSDVCRDSAAARPPYWLSDAAVTVDGPGAGWPAITPVDASVDPSAALASAVSARITRWDTTGASMTIDQPSAGWIYLDRAWWPGWRTTIDGQTVPTYRAMAGTLVRVPAGQHQIEQDLVPWDAGLGLLAGMVAVAIAVAWCLRGSQLWSRRRPRTRASSRRRP